MDGNDDILCTTPPAAGVSGRDDDDVDKDESRDGAVWRALGVEEEGPAPEGWEISNMGGSLIAGKEVVRGCEEDRIDKSDRSD